MWRMLPLMLLSLSQALPALAADLRVEIHAPGLSGIPVRLALFNREEGFPLGKPFRQEDAVLAGETLPFRFTGLIPGIHALAAYADVNGNGQLDKDWLGRPSEPYALSENPRPILRQPGFRDAAFTLSEGEQVHVLRLR